MDRILKVYFDQNPLESGHAIRGVGTYARNLLGQLTKRTGVKLVELREDADVLHYPFFDLFFPTLNVSSLSTVVTVFDVIPLIYLKHYPPGIKGRINFLRQKRALGKTSAVITISETSKKDIVRFLDIPPEKIYPIHLAPAPYFRKLVTGNWQLAITKRYHLPTSFVLYVGDVNYNKNVLGLVEACKSIKLSLVIVGKQAVETSFDRFHPENQPLAQLIEKYGNDPSILRLGFVPNSDLVAIYNLATVYCQPSFYEGFGLSVLEAMACGCPVVAAKTQALVEIAEDAALFVNPHNPKDIAKGLENILSDVTMQGELVERGLKYVKNFSWDKVADETFKVYQRVVS